MWIVFFSSLTTQLPNPIQLDFDQVGLVTKFSKIGPNLIHAHSYRSLLVYLEIDFLAYLKVLLSRKLINKFLS